MATAALATAATALTGCGGNASGTAAAPQLKVSGGYVPQPPMADMATGYFTVTNTGAGDDRLTSVSSDLAPEVTMHSTQGGAMRAVSSFPVPAKGRLVLSTGGNHLMLMKLKRRPAVGDKVSFQLHFAKSAPITVEVPVEPASYHPKG
nr:copper chaperone PCu(A)C [Streptomyces sp. SID5468]